VKERNLKLPRLIHKGNWKIILYCFLGASIFWFFNALNKDYTASIRQPLEFVFDREGLVVVRLPDEVNVNVSGGGWNLLRKTSWFNVKPIQINLESPTSTRVMIGSSLRPLLSDQLDEFTVNFVISDSLFIDVELETQKSIPILVDSIALNLRNRFRVTSPINLSKDTLRITGPESMINSFPDTFIVRIEEQRIDDDFDRDVEINGLPKFIRAEPEEIEVSFRVSKFVNRNKELTIQYSGFPLDSSISLSSERIQLIFLANENMDEQIPDSLFSMVAYLEDVNPEDSTLLPRLEKHPSFIEPVGIDSSSIKVIYE